MTISTEHFSDMDASLLTHEEAIQTILEQVNTGELAETHDFCASICLSGLTETYSRLVAEDHDATDPALHSGVQKALVAGWHMATIIMPESVQEPAEHFHALPTNPDQTDVASIAAWARRQPQTGRLAMGIAAKLAEQEGDEGLTSPLATAISFSLYYSDRPNQETLPHAS